MARRIACLLLAMLFVFLLPGCGKKGADTVIRFDLSQSVASLDPQFATRTSERIVIANLYEGLMTQNAEGEIAPGAASGYTVSGDGRTYTFSIRPNAQWADGTPLTAEDFQFALRRLFDPETPSPYANVLTCIAGSQAVLDGTKPVEELGVTVQNGTLVIRLEEPEPNLPALLCASYAMPCNEAFFREQKGRYGVSIQRVLGNGPFMLTSWDNSKSVRLRVNEQYVGEEPVLAGGVDFSIQRESDPMERFMAGESDAAIISYSRLGELEKTKCTWQAVEDTTWALLFNVREGEYSSLDIRQAMTSSIDRESFARSLTGDAQHTTELVPPAVKMTGQSYREQAGTVGALIRSDPKALFSTGLSVLELEKLGKTDLLVPNGKMERTAAASLQRSWQDGLNAYINVLPLEQSELESRVQQGDFQIALIPLQGSVDGPVGLLNRFTSSSLDNWSGYASSAYDSLLQQAGQASTSQGVVQRMAQAERMLIEDAVVVPLYNTATYVAQGEGISGIQYGGPVGDWYFKYAGQK